MVIVHWLWNIQPHTAIKRTNREDKSRMCSDIGSTKVVWYLHLYYYFWASEREHSWEWWLPKYRLERSSAVSVLDLLQSPNLRNVVDVDPLWLPFFPAFSFAARPLQSTLFSCQPKIYFLKFIRNWYEGAKVTLPIAQYKERGGDALQRRDVMICSFW